MFKNQDKYEIHTCAPTDKPFKACLLYLNWLLPTCFIKELLKHLSLYHCIRYIEVFQNILFSL